jgi:hypothetical protein
MIVTTASIILAVLKLINMIMSTVDQEQWKAAGYDEAVAEASKAIMARTAAGKAMLEKVNAMSDSQVSDALHNLEPK